jgi:hypothetical protein
MDDPRLKKEMLPPTRAGDRSWSRGVTFVEGIRDSAMVAAGNSGGGSDLMREEPASVAMASSAVCVGAGAFTWSLLRADHVGLMIALLSGYAVLGGAVFVKARIWARIQRRQSLEAERAAENAAHLQDLEDDLATKIASFDGSETAAAEILEYFAIAHFGGSRHVVPLELKLAESAFVGDDAPSTLELERDCDAFVSTGYGAVAVLRGFSVCRREQVSVGQLRERVYDQLVTRDEREPETTVSAAAKGR